MPQRFTPLETLHDDSVTSLFRADDSKTQAEVWVRRFKTTDNAAREGLVSLFEALKTIGHDGLETVHDVGRDDEGVFILTAPPRGDTLDEIVQQGPLSIREFEDVTSQVLDALSALHDRAIMHGALRAEHLLIDRSGGEGAWKVRIQGFGQGFGPVEDGKEPPPSVYACAAPEQWEAGQARRRTDVYAMGCLLYQAAAARPPFDAKTLKELRHKHLKHDVRSLEKLAPQLPAWMSAWVMRLIATDADERPRKAGIALELYRQQGKTAHAPPQDRIERGKITDAVTPSIMPLSAPGTQPLAQGTSPVIASSGRPGRATSGTIAVPINQTGQVAVPAVVGRPVRNRVPASGATQVAGLPPAIRFGAVGAVIALLVGIALFKQLTKAPPVQWDKVAGLPVRAEAQPARRDALPYPADRPGPIAKDRLLVHYRAETGVETFSGPRETRPATAGDTVALWSDLGTVNRDNELAHFPWDPDRTSIQWAWIDPTPANGLARPLPFIQFQPQGSPPATLNLAARNDEDLWPFGLKADPGLTLAVVFIHPKATTDHLVVALRAKSFITSLRIGADNTVRLFAGDNRPAAAEGEKATAMPSRDFDPSAVTLAIVRWRVNPDRIHFTLSNGRGQRFESLTEARKRPDVPLSEITLGGGPAVTYSNPKSRINVFRGAIAELLLYPTELSDAEMAQMESGLKAHYFK